MPTDALTFSPFASGHIQGALPLSRAAGWPHRAEDWAFVLGQSRGIAAIAGGDVVATALTSPFGKVAMINMIIVDERLRGRGLGRGMMEAVMRLADPVEWRLTATSDGLPLYEKLGFAATGEVLQHQGIAMAPDGAPTPDAPLANDIGPATEADLDALAMLDTAATGMARRPLIAELLRLGSITVLRDNGRIVAFCALRSFGMGEVAGPLVARDLAEAEQLLGIILARREGRFLRVDTTADAGLAPWLARHGLAPVGGGIAMRRGMLPVAASAYRRFALAAQALG